MPPPGFSTLEIPAATYAVFRITLDGSALHPQVKQYVFTPSRQARGVTGKRYRWTVSPEFDIV